MYNIYYEEKKLKEEEKKKKEKDNYIKYKELFCILFLRIICSK